MAKKKYRLQPLLTIKTRAKKRAEIQLAKAIKALKEAKEKLEELIKEKEEIIEAWNKARDEMYRVVGAGALVGEGDRHVSFLRKLKEDEEKKQEEIEEQELIVEECEEDVARCRRDYIDASKELQIMEKHKELWEKKVKEELSQQEAKEMDDLGANIHELKRWRGEKSIGEV